MKPRPLGPTTMREIKVAINGELRDFSHVFARGSGKINIFFKSRANVREINEKLAGN